MHPITASQTLEEKNLYIVCAKQIYSDLIQGRTRLVEMKKVPKQIAPKKVRAW